MSDLNKDLAHLRHLGTGSMPRPQTPPSADMLDIFPNRHSDRDYVIKVSCPEFTSVCPVTGQPDFGTIVIEYIPDQYCVESKSLKLYLFAYREHASFMESITNTFCDHLVERLDPRWIKVSGLFVPRGGIEMHVFAEHTKSGFKK